MRLFLSKKMGNVCFGASDDSESAGNNVDSVRKRETSFSCLAI